MATLAIADGGSSTMLIVEPREEVRRALVAGAALAEEQDVWAVEDLGAARQVLADRPLTGIVVCPVELAAEVAQLAPRGLLILTAAADAAPGVIERLRLAQAFDALVHPILAQAAGEALRAARDQLAAEQAADESEASLVQRHADQVADDLALEHQEADLPRLERIRAELSAAVLAEMEVGIAGAPALLDQAEAAIADENTRAAIVDAGFAARSAAHMVSDLADVVRAERVALPIAPREVAVAELVDEALAGVARIAADYQAQLTVHRTGEATRFCTDPGLARRAVENLIECGLRRSRKGRVTVSVDARDERLRFEVTDAGGQVQAASLPALFTHHARLETGTLQRGASLAFCRAVTAALGGSVDASAVEGGLRVAMELFPSAAVAQAAIP